jgi:hypothetical protein
MQTMNHMKGNLKMEKSIHIKQLDNLTVQYIRQRLRVFLDQLSGELNIMIELGNSSLKSSCCRIPLNLSVLDLKGKPVREEAEVFKNNAALFGFEEADLGKEFSVKGQTYTISGFSPKNHKSPVLARSKNGRTTKFPCRVVLEALGRKVPGWM